MVWEPLTASPREDADKTDRSGDVYQLPRSGFTGMGHICRLKRWVRLYGNVPERSGSVLLPDGVAVDAKNFH